MRIFSDKDELPVFQDPVVTVGSFDGVHLGHARLLNMMKERAHATGGETVVVSFAEHPRRVIHAEDDIKLLTSHKEKAFLLENLGLDNLYLMSFSEQVSRLSPEDFLRDFLIGRLGAKEFVVGYNHHFGHGKKGDAATLKEMELKYGFKVFEAPCLDKDGRKVSSTEIRKAVGAGDMSLAGQLLGHPYIIMAVAGENGKVVYDESLKLLPPPGRYPVAVNGHPGTYVVGENGSASLELSGGMDAGSELLISFPGVVSGFAR